MTGVNIITILLAVRSCGILCHPSTDSCSLVSLLLWIHIIEHNMPTDTRDGDFHDLESNDAEIGVAHNLIDSRRSPQNSLDHAEHAYPSAYHASMTGKGMITPSPNEECFPAPPPPLRQSQILPVVVPIGMRTSWSTTPVLTTHFRWFSRVSTKPTFRRSRANIQCLADLSAWKPHWWQWYA